MHDGFCLPSPRLSFRLPLQLEEASAVPEFGRLLTLVDGVEKGLREAANRDSTD